uniref:Orf 5' D1A dopamine receptor protein n=1 Tax=Didelphis virginiana TaxID=9267 RepID=Q65ZP8_DIDVI|nr:orf 5' D1A dopamine receptor gene product [Didelphis virginiana]
MTLKASCSAISSIL